MGSTPPLLFLLNSLFLFSTLLTPITSSAPSNGTTTSTSTSRIRTLCESTPYPDRCFDSLKLSISIGINPSILTFALHSLEAAISYAADLSSILSSVQGGGVVDGRPRGTALQDCEELHLLTLSSLRASASLLRSSKLADVRTQLSAALTNKNTCFESLDGASGPMKPSLVGSITTAYEHVSNSLSLVSQGSGSDGKQGRRLYGGFPQWLKPRDRKLLQSGGDDDGDYDGGSTLTVAADGSGNFTTIGDAIGFAPNNSDDRTMIIVREGLYEENVDVPWYKTNIVLLGEGSDVTVIRGNRSVGDGWTTFRSATVAVSGTGFLARDITFQNTAGPAKGQAVALRVNADVCAVYLCSIDGYQDTLYVHSFRQFYRECDIFGTVDFVFGNAAVIFQASNLVVKKPMSNQFNAITAQSRDDPNEATGISIQNCSILASDDLSSSGTKTRTYLGRPWRPYSRTVYIESYIDGLVDPSGWTEWSSGEGQGLDTLYYGEYENSGPGSGTEGRVSWPGFHVMGYDEASNFTVSEFIYGDQWLDSTSFPYDDGV